MRPTSARLRELFRQHGPLRSHELEHHGLSRMQLSRMVAAGELQQVARGLYALPTYQPSEHMALVTVARRAPNAVFCLLTALRLHDMTT
ncbi:MAG: type IV toxin-antitoxin system AbiEi family antitoxin domain-containing protein, partial [Burkholderiaceae bacterium]